MSEPLGTEPYKGVRDFYPEDWARLHALFTTLRTTLERAGYAEYNASPLERAELYESKTSEEIVNEQTYTFTDRGDRRVTLRPEMTPTLARMVAAKRRELALPIRWFSIGSRFRYERPQKGRLREFYQTDVDVVGLAEGAIDEEILCLAHELLTAYGASAADFTVRVNSRPLLNAACAAAGLDGEAVAQYVRLLDKKKKMPAEEFAAATRALTAIDPLDLIEQPTAGSVVEQEKNKLLERIERVRAAGASTVVFDPAITRGFDYYTGMVFEVFDTNAENPRSIFGGGRYDGLVALFGGEPIPAIGFGIGDVTLADFLTTHGLYPETITASADLYLGTPTPQDRSAAQHFATTLRARGVRVWVNLTERSLGDQIKDAVKRDIPFFVAYGAEEAASGTLRVKTLATSTETSVPESELVTHLRS